MRQHYALRYFHKPTARWSGSRIYDPDQSGLSMAADDYVKLAQKPDVGAVKIYEPGGDLLFEDEWVPVPLITAAVRLREAQDALKGIG